MNELSNRITILIAPVFLYFPLQAYASTLEKNGGMTTTPVKNWSDIAIRDIKRAHEIVSEAHPAKLDASNLEFNDWLDSGYQQSILLAGRSKSEDQAFAALRFYLTGFMDEHLVVWRSTPKLSQLYWAGWNMDYTNGRYRVASRSADWPVELPQKGDEVISCDGISVLDILRSKVAPFVNRRIHLENTLNKLAKYITIEQSNSPLWESFRPMNCMFQKPNGNYHKLPLTWKMQPKNLKSRSHPVPKQGMHQLKKGVYWIHASNFKLDAEEHVRFENLLDEVRSLDTADAIVLDTRGNEGGNSMVGSILLETLLKDLAPPHETPKAYWRVSPISRATLDDHRSSALQIEGKEGLSYKWLSGMIESMDAATLRGDLFAEQIDISIEEDRKTPQGRPAFEGKLILITDSYCNSACLDFVGEVVSIPGALHVGNTTDADTRYMDVGSAVLPSGLKMWTPLKFWVDRRRQDNVPYVPQIKYHQDINDTEALQTWVLQSILPLAKNIATP